MSELKGFYPKAIVLALSDSTKKVRAFILLLLEGSFPT